MSKKQRKPSGGVGTEVARLIGWMKPGGCDECLCSLRANEMDRRGITWCRENRETILDWLQEGAKQCGVPFSRTIAAQVLRVAERNAQRREAAQRNRMEPTDGQGRSDEEAEEAAQEGA